MKTGEEVLKLIDKIISTGYESPAIAIVSEDKEISLKDYFGIDDAFAEDTVKRGIYVYNVDPVYKLRVDKVFNIIEYGVTISFFEV
jgi:hypothetical protein